MSDLNLNVTPLALDADLVLIHDPQPAGLAELRRRPGQRWVWRCHIDLSNADPKVWDLVAPRVTHYDAAIFSHVSFVPSLPVPAYLARLRSRARSSRYRNSRGVYSWTVNSERLRRLKLMVVDLEAIGGSGIKDRG